MFWESSGAVLQKSNQVICSNCGNTVRLREFDNEPILYFIGIEGKFLRKINMSIILW